MNNINFDVLTNSSLSTNKKREGYSNSALYSIDYSNQNNNNDILNNKNNEIKKYIQNLKSKSKDERNRAARGIRLYVEQEARERSGEGFIKVLNSLVKKIEDFSLSNDPYEIMGSIILIDELVEIAVAGENERILIKFVNILSSLIESQKDSSKNNVDVEALESSAKALGHIARVLSPGLTYDLLEQRVKVALDWLQNSKVSSNAEMNKIASMLIITELAENAPAVFHSHVLTFFDLIWDVLTDKKINVRIRARYALRNVFSLISHRKSDKSRKYYNKIYSSARNVFPLKNKSFPTKKNR